MPKQLRLLPLVLLSLFLFANLQAGSQQTAFLPTVRYDDTPVFIGAEVFATDFNEGVGYANGITDITHAGDERLFVLEQHGLIRIVMPDGTVLDEPFLDIRGSVATTNWEQGVLGLAFHPNYPETPYFYLTYTANLDNQIRLVRYSVSGDPNIADRATRQFVMSIGKTPSGEDEFGNTLYSPVHNGGDLNFGPDGYLYLSVGDGGPDPNFGSTVHGDPEKNSQNMQKLLGKMIRIDVDGNGNPPECDPNGNYTIPADNPFVDGVGGNCDEIWALGLRNPWRFSFDAITDDMYIGDVGEWEYEEINVQPSGQGGQNYGWRCWEGTYDHRVDHNIEPECFADEAYTFPVHIYENAGFSPTDGCSVTGGFVYYGQAYPFLRGKYVYGDNCNGNMWTLFNSNGEWRNSLDGNAQMLLSTFGTDVNGEIYMGEWKPDGAPALYRLTATQR